MTILLSYLFYFIVGSASPLQRRWLATTKREAEPRDQIFFAFTTTLIVAILGLFVPLFSKFELSANYFQIATLGILCGLFGAGFFIFSYVAQKHIEAGVSTLVSNIYTPITIILATTFLGEKLSLQQIFGTLLLLFAIVLISKKHRTGKFTFDKYFLMMLASGIMLGVLLTAERALQKTTGFSAGTLISWWSQAIFLGIITLITKSQSSYSAKDVLTTGFLKFLQGLSWVTLLFTVGNLSVVSSITTFKIVIIFIAAAIFLKEREDLPRKILGSLIAVAGLLLMK